MKRIIFICCGILSLFFYACSGKNDIHADLGDSWYNLTDDPSDPVQHYIYGFYQNFGTVIVTDPSIRDYRFNFGRKNNILVVPPRQDPALMAKGLDFVKKIFLDVYPDFFKKDFFPYNIIMADSVLFLGMEDARPSYHAFASSNFIVIANIREGLENYSSDLVKEIKGDVNGRFWADFLSGVEGVFHIPDEFYEVSAAWYGNSWMGGETPDDIDCHEMGFVDFDWGNTSYDEDDGGWWVQVPNQKIDKSQWMAFMFNTTPDERTGIFARYPLMEKKYNMLKEAMKKCGGFDVSTVK